MIVINEWLPNPTGSDATGSPAKVLPGKILAGEWVELWNSGGGSVDLSGWRLTTKSGSKAVLWGQIEAGRYAIFYRTKTKLVLKNSDESLFLYNSEGKLIDQSAFWGSAPGGKSFSRFGNGDSTWSDPTPGTQNKTSLDTGVEKNIYPPGVPLNRPLGTQGMIGLTLGVGVIFAAIAIFITKKDADLSKFFFGKN